MSAETTPSLNPKPVRADKLGLNTLSDEFDALLEQMQQPGVRAAMQAAFDSSPEELGRAAVEEARKRG